MYISVYLSIGGWKPVMYSPEGPEANSCSECMLESMRARFTK
jgi:hypothetical protein